MPGSSRPHAVQLTHTQAQARSPSHSLVVGIPSGLTITFFPKIPEIRTLGPETGSCRLPAPGVEARRGPVQRGRIFERPLLPIPHLVEGIRKRLRGSGKWRRQHKRHVITVAEELIP